MSWDLVWTKDVGNPGAGADLGGKLRILFQAGDA